MIIFTSFTNLCFQELMIVSFFLFVSFPTHSNNSIKCLAIYFSIQSILPDNFSILYVMLETASPAMTWPLAQDWLFLRPSIFLGVSFGGILKIPFTSLVLHLLFPKSKIFFMTLSLFPYFVEALFFSIFLRKDV